MGNILVIAPHPDDDVIGCGGSIIKHVKNGHEVTVVYMTSGDAGSAITPKRELARIRENEAITSTTSLGVKPENLIFLRNPDGYLECNQKNLVELIELIRSKMPDLVYTPHKEDGHKDHRVSHELTVEAVGRAAGPWFQEAKGKPWSTNTVLGYEVWTPMNSPQYVEDISEEIGKKVEAILLHESQVAGIKYDEATEALNRYRGATTGKGKHCECFQVIKTNLIPCQSPAS